MPTKVLMDTNAYGKKEKSDHRAALGIAVEICIMPQYILNSHFKLKKKKSKNTHAVAL